MKKLTKLLVIVLALAVIFGSFSIATAEDLKQVKLDEKARLKIYKKSAFTDEGWNVVKIMLDEAAAAIDAATDISTVKEISQCAHAKVSYIKRLDRVSPGEYPAETWKYMKPLIHDAYLQVGAIAPDDNSSSTLLVTESRLVGVILIGRGLNKEDYTSKMWRHVETVINRACKAIVASVDAAEIDSKVNITLEKLKGFKRLGAGLNEEDYTSKMWRRVETVINRACKAIVAAEVTGEINSAVLQAKLEIETLEVGGCGTTKQATSGIVLGGLAAAVVVLSKKKED